MILINQADTQIVSGCYLACYSAGKTTHLGKCKMLMPGIPVEGRLVKTFAGVFLAAFLAISQPVLAQSAVSKKKFFKEDELITMAIVSDFKKLINEKTKQSALIKYQPATITCVFPDGRKLTEEIEIKPRGQFRRSECYIPPVMINFKTNKAPGLKKLGHLKLVWPCATNAISEQLVLKEYLVYKMYNLLTNMSFRVRLVKMTYHDKEERIKSRTQFAFFIEDVEDMAERQDCVEVVDQMFHTERTNRRQTTLVALFEYMIGNTDWAVPIYRNIKLIRSEKDSSSRPFVVPYDFDYCGLVNAGYAIPVPELNINSVRERLYRGFPRTKEELQEAFQIFRTQRKAMDSLINNFEPLLPGYRKDMVKYLDAFFKIISNEKNLNHIFIEGAKME